MSLLLILLVVISFILISHLMRSGDSDALHHLIMLSVILGGAYYLFKDKNKETSQIESIKTSKCKNNTCKNNTCLYQNDTSLKISQDNSTDIEVPNDMSLKISQKSEIPLPGTKLEQSNESDKLPDDKHYMQPKNPNYDMSGIDFLYDRTQEMGDDKYTAANLHFSRKPKEAALFQYRWGVNSLRPWFAQELNDHENSIWWEDFGDLQQYM